MNRRDFIKSAAVAGVLINMNNVSSGSQSQRVIRWGIIGVGSRGYALLRTLATMEGAEVTAICDINEENLNRALANMAKQGIKKPVCYTKGPYDYRNMLERDDIDAVLVATPILVHASMAADALNAHKHIISEVPGAFTVDDCWALVEASEKNNAIYMLAENACYFQNNLMIMNMVNLGVFGETTYAECGYIHYFTPDRMANPDGSFTWRGELKKDYFGNVYPTHGLGPVAQWLGINRGDRFESLISMDTGNAAMMDKAVRAFGADDPRAKIKYASKDMTYTLIRTAKGKVIDLQYDSCSLRPHPDTVHYYLQGLKAAYKDEDLETKIYIEERSEKFAWEPLTKYEEEFDAPIWNRWKVQAQGSGHRGADYFEFAHFMDTIRTGKESPIDAYDSAAWSVIAPLSAQSIREGSTVQEIPDFTRGKWKRRV